jgi:uncharacterized MAPEG superfamily protein
MTTELWYLFLTTILLTILWIPFIIQQVMSKGLLTPEDYVNLRDDSKFSAAIRRANRTHVNLVEQFGAFAGLVVVAHLIGLSNGITQTAVMVYFWARVAHALVMLIGFKHFMARTLIFTVSFLSLLVLAWQIFAASM